MALSAVPADPPQGALRGHRVRRRRLLRIRGEAGARLAALSRLRAGAATGVHAAGQPGGPAHTMHRHPRRTRRGAAVHAAGGGAQRPARGPAGPPPRAGSPRWWRPGLMAVFPAEIAATHTLLLEPLLDLFCLLGAVLVFEGDRIRDGGRRLLLGGLALGFAGTIKGWALIPGGGPRCSCLPHVRRRRGAAARWRGHRLRGAHPAIGTARPGLLLQRGDRQPAAQDRLLGAGADDTSRRPDRRVGAHPGPRSSLLWP